MNEGVLGSRQAAIALGDGSRLAVGIGSDEHADLARFRPVCRLVDRSYMGSLGSGSEGRLVGEGAQYVEIGSNHRDICLLGSARQLKHLGLALIAEVRRVGPRLLENCRKPIGRNRARLLEVDLDPSVGGFDVAACRRAFWGDDDRFDAQPSAGPGDAGRGLSTAQDQYFLKHRRSIATDRIEAPRAPA